MTTGKEKVTLYSLQMRYNRAEVKDVQGLENDTLRYLKTEYESSDKLKQGGDYVLEKLSDIWAFVHENIERNTWKNYTREDWEELEREYVERADYTEPDLFDDILTSYEKGELTADEARAKAKEYRKCKYRFCLNVFKPRRKNQYYCPDSDCSQKEYEAKQRFKKTGTYLPAVEYEGRRDDTNTRNYKKNEIAFDMEDNEEMFYRFMIKDEFGGKRDPKREAYYEIQKYKQNEEIDAETKLIHKKKPVTNRRILSEYSVS